MKEKKHDIEEIFASKLKGFEMDVPDAVWSRLSDKLTEGKVAPQPKRLSKRVVLWWSIGAVASLLLLMLAIRQEGKDSPINKLRDESRNIVQETKREPESIRNYARNEPVLTSPRKVQGKPQALVNLPQVSSRLQEGQGELPENVHVNQESRIEDVAAQPANKSGEARPDPDLQRKTNEFSHAAKETADKLFADADVKTSKHKKESRKLGLMATGGLGLSSQTKAANQLLSLDGYAEAASDLKSNNNFMSVQSMKSSSNSTYQLDHSWPISFSVGVTKPLTSFLNLELGISYTYLYSKQRGESDASMRQSQQFSYIGLPVGLNFRVATWDRFRLGVLLGGSIQKDVAGRLKQEIKASSSYEDYSTNSIHQKRIQPSINANLHLSYSIGKNFSLFGKVGGAYYFDMNDTYNTIYSDKNFLPDIGLGLSYNFEY